MSRYRPPSQPAAPYITPQGRDRLMNELRHLSDTQRPEVTKALAEAAAEGDRSENAEYIYRKKQLREIDRRIRYLVKRLEVVKAVDKKPADQSRIFFGAWVELGFGLVLTSGPGPHPHPHPNRDPNQGMCPKGAHRSGRTRGTRRGAL